MSGADKVKNKIEDLGGRAKEATRDLDSCRFELIMANPAISTVALDLLQLVAIDREIAGWRLRCARARQRPNHSAKRRYRHYPQNEPERHIDQRRLRSRSVAARGAPPEILKLQHKL